MENLNVFLLFPATDEEILALGEDYNNYSSVPQDLALIKSLLPNGCYKFFYDSENIAAFCNKASQLCSDVYLYKLKEQLLNLLRKNALNVSKQPLHKFDRCYYQWDGMNASICIRNDSLFKSAAECNEKTIVISFLYQDSWHRGIVPILIDALHYQNLPALSNIPYFNPIGTFVEWYNNHGPNSFFYLSDTSRFERTCWVRRESKQRIYKEIETDRYWYYDFFHKDNSEHYEVFDSVGNHIGEADCNGIIDESKKDNNKSIRNILR